ncbi:TOG array regulator of axonemal microtubules protein 1-like [Hoplias malabaricus]|uniref:TOG array regulator of axonemal microtubules protein 1-like n=1 Tax=Hoplias malabaricus TaxID=27720 RepID=UPI0034622E9D
MNKNLLQNRRCVHKMPSRVNPAFERGLQQIEKAHNETMLARAHSLSAKFEKNQEENIRAIKSTFMPHLNLTDAESKGSQQTIYVPRPPEKNLRGVDKCHPLKPIRNKGINSNVTALGSCSSSMTPTTETTVTKKKERPALSAFRGLEPEPPSEPIKPRNKSSRFRRLLTPPELFSTASNTAEQPLFQEEALTTPELGLMQAFSLLKALDWEKKVAGLKYVRALAEHHEEVLIPKLHDIVLLLMQEVKNPRSAVARAAMATLGHMYIHLKKAMHKELDSTVSVLLLKAGESNNFIRDDVERALGHMLQNCNPKRALNALVTTGIGHRNAAVRQCTAPNLQKLAELMKAPRVLSNKSDFTRLYLVSISQLALDAAQDVRFHARNSLRLLSTHKDFNKMVDKFVPQKEKPFIRSIITKLRA